MTADTDKPLFSPTTWPGDGADDREQRIRRRAYEIWEAEGRPSGRSVDHWAQAERQLDGDRESVAEATNYGMEEQDTPADLLPTVADPTPRRGRSKR